MRFFYSVRALIRWITGLWFRMEITGTENIPSDGGVILCANHNSLWDPVLIGSHTKRPIHFMAKRQLFKNKLFDWVLRKLCAFPVDRDGADISALKNSLKILKRGDVLGIFPEGTRRDSIDIKHFKEGVSLIAQRSQATILPVRIRSTFRFRAPVAIEYREPIDPVALTEGLTKAEATERITQAVFAAIYKEEIAHEDHHRE